LGACHFLSAITNTSYYHTPGPKAQGQSSYSQNAEGLPLFSKPFSATLQASNFGEGRE
jgi:hypothetical protein